MRALSRKILLSVGSLAFALAAGEALLRIFHHAPQPTRRYVWRPPSVKSPLPPPRLHRYVPGGEFRQIYFKFDGKAFRPDKRVLFKINSLGYRDKERSVEKPANTFRILGLGDSFTTGDGVDVKRTYLRELERMLNRRFQGTPRFECINMAVAKYTTLQELAVLKEDGLKYKPDLVLLGFYLNDTLPIYRSTQAAHFGVKPIFESMADTSVWGNIRPSRAERRPLYIVRLAAGAVRNIVESRTTIQTYRLWYSDRNKLGLRQFEDSLKEMAAIARRNRMGMLMVVWPKLERLNYWYPFKEIHRYVAGVAEGDRVPVLDLFPVFQGHSAKDLWAHPTDHHPNALAHKMAARAIYDKLIAEKMLP